jgi:hypothetical protein
MNDFPEITGQPHAVQSSTPKAEPVVKSLTKLMVMLYSVSRGESLPKRAAGRTVVRCVAINELFRSKTY